MHFNALLIVLTLSSAASTQKKCRIRDAKQLYPLRYFTLLSGQLCADNVNKVWYRQKPKFYFRKEDYGGESYPVLYTLDEERREISFDFENETSARWMRRQFTQDSYFEKWKLCAQTAKDCCKNFLTEEDMHTNEEYVCPALWDGFTCYGKARAHTTIEKPCPLYTTSSDKYVCELQSEKYCLATDWDHVTNYIPCAEAPVYRRRHKFHLAVLYTAVALILPSTLIYAFFHRKLNTLRVSLHRNLILAILVKNILVIISKELVIMDALDKATRNVMRDNGVACRVLAFFENLSKNVIFTCMSVDAFYLHKLIVRAFAAEPNERILYGIVAVCSTIPSLAWATLMGANEKEHCWMVDDSWYIWITDGYKYVMLTINLFLFFDILRVLITKLGKGSNKKQTKSAFKATLILLPLFGVPLLITSQRSLVDSNDCLASDIYYYVTYSIEAGQGILLVVYFCYLNKEVREAIKNQVGKWETKIRENLDLPRKSIPRRTTGTTNVP